MSATTLPSAAILQIPPFLRGDSEARAWAWLLQRIGVTEDRVPRGAASAQSSPRPSKFPHSDADVDPQKYTRRVHSRRCDDWPIDSGVKLVRVWNKQAAEGYIERCATPSSPNPPCLRSTTFSFLLLPSSVRFLFFLSHVGRHVCRFLRLLPVRLCHLSLSLLTVRCGVIKG